jgi:hypothetical protein
MAGALAVLSRLICSIWRWWRSTSTAPALGLGLGRGSAEKSIGAPGPLHAARSGRLGMQGYLLLHAYALMCAHSAVTSQESGKEAADFLCERMTGGPGRSLGRC